MRLLKTKLTTVSRTLFIGILIVFLTGCSSFGREDVGTVAGGVAGGYAGSALTSGSTLGTVAGAVGGAVAGREIAKRTK